MATWDSTAGALGDDLVIIDNTMYGSTADAGHERTRTLHDDRCRDAKIITAPATDDDNVYSIPHKGRRYDSTADHDDPVVDDGHITCNVEHDDDLVIVDNLIYSPTIPHVLKDPQQETHEPYENSINTSDTPDALNSSGIPQLQVNTEPRAVPQTCENYPDAITDNIGTSYNSAGAPRPRYKQYELEQNVNNFQNNPYETVIDAETSLDVDGNICDNVSDEICGVIHSEVCDTMHVETVDTSPGADILSDRRA